MLESSIQYNVSSLHILNILLYMAYIIIQIDIFLKDIQAHKIHH